MCVIPTEKKNYAFVLIYVVFVGLIKEIHTYVSVCVCLNVRNAEKMRISICYVQNCSKHIHSKKNSRFNCGNFW